MIPARRSVVGGVVMASMLASGALAQGYRLDGLGGASAAMGGAGVALARGPLDALHLNPALLGGAEGWGVEVAATYRDSEQTLSSRVGPFFGSTAHDGEPELMPSWAWGWRPAGGRMTWGVGLLTAAQWSAEFPQDPRNPLLAPQPAGFGAVHSSYTVERLPLALAYEVSPQVTLGASLGIGRATFSATPALFALPDCSGAVVCFFPSVAESSATAIGFSAGALVDFGDSLHLGLSYSTGEDYDFDWNSQVANPNLPTFGTGRRVSLTVEEPPVVSVGLAFTPGDRWAVALDARQIGYEGSGDLADALALDDVTVVAFGVEWKAGERLALRAGAARSDSPVTNPFFVRGIPVSEQLVSAGFGYRFGERAELAVAFQRALDEEISGPFVGGVGAIPGTEVTHETAGDALTVSFSFRGGS